MIDAKGMTDEELARKAQCGDGEAFVEIAHRHQHVVYRLAYRFAGTAEDADDLSQECMLRAYRQIRKYDRRRPFKPWLMRLCANVCLNWAKTRSRTASREEPLCDDLWIDGRESVEKATMKMLERQSVLEALAELPPETRLLIAMRFTLGQTLREISEQTGIKLPTVAFRITRAVEQLRQRLIPEGVEE